MKRVKNWLGAFSICALLLSGSMFVDVDYASAKSVIKTNDHKQNKITGNRGEPFNYVYFSVPSSAYLNSKPSTRINKGIIYDTYRNYWIYYSSTTKKYYP